MKTRSTAIVVIALVFSGVLTQASPVGTAFTYNGRLMDGGDPANGRYDFTFTLHSAESVPAQVGLPLTTNAVAVSNELFVVNLDFGAGVFNGDARWLEIAVKTNGAATFTTLTPRQELTPTPYALYAGNAALFNGQSPTAYAPATGSPAYVAKAGDTMTGPLVVPGNGLRAGANQLVLSGGNVGIGTTAPSQRLEVAGNLSYSGALSKLDVAEQNVARVAAQDLWFGHSSRRGALGRALVDLGGATLGDSLALNYAQDWQGLALFGRVALDPWSQNTNGLIPGLLFGGGSSGEGIASKRDPGGNQYGLDFYTASQPRLSVANNGDVGIGTSTPLDRLDVRGGVSADWLEIGNRGTGNHYAGIDLHGDDTYSDFGLRILRNNAGPNSESWIMHKGSGPLWLRTEEPGSSILLDTPGNVGIGVGGWSPQAKLDVVGNALVRGPSFATEGDSAMLFLGDPSHSIRSVWGGGLRLSTFMVPDGITLLERSGNVGIGTTNPAAKLEVDGTVKATALDVGGVPVAASGGALTVSGQPIISGSVQASNLAPNSITTDAIADGAITATDVNAASLSTLFWKLDGNSGTTAGANFLGTTDGQPLELRVNGQRALRLEPNTNTANVIGGYQDNYVAMGAYGATIAGGGRYLSPNHVDSPYGMLGGGWGNIVAPGAEMAVIGGGDQNAIWGPVAWNSVIGGGEANAVLSNSPFATIGGGRYNAVLHGGSSATIAGGWDNHAGSVAATIAGGRQNSIGTNSSCGAIGGGGWNTVATNAEYATIPGGLSNSASMTLATVAGGGRNTASGTGSSIGGGGNHTASGSYAVIGGGEGNEAFGSGAAVAGGHYNTASGPGSFVGGGWGTRLSQFPFTVFHNLASGENSVVTGGYNNEAGGRGAVVPGGYHNEALGNFSLAAGQHAEAKHDGCFVWADATGGALTSTTSNQFLIRARDGLHIINQNNTSIGQLWAETAGQEKIFFRVGTNRFDFNGYDGTFACRILQINGGADVAEPFQVSTKDIPKGAVVVIDDQNPGQLKMSQQPYDTRVAGVISGANGINPGITLNQEGLGEGGHNVALSGRVYVQAETSNGPIRPGDLLTTSSIAGHAMRVTDHSKAQGAILGKAMTDLSGGKGMVLVLVSLQ